MIFSLLLKSIAFIGRICFIWYFLVDKVMKYMAGYRRAIIARMSIKIVNSHTLLDLYSYCQFLIRWPVKILLLESNFFWAIGYFWTPTILLNCNACTTVRLIRFNYFQGRSLYSSIVIKSDMIFAISHSCIIDRYTCTYVKMYV